jgi:hypothetical protein
MTSSAPETTPTTAPAASIDDAAPLARRLLAAWIAHHRLILGIVLLGCFVAVRVAYVGADPPKYLPNGARIYELFTDPPAKSYEARNWALFGAWSLAPLDNYQFWRIQAPAWVYPIAGFYRLFGVGYAQMRIFSTICSALGLVAVLAIAAQRLRGWAYLLAGTFLTFNFYYVVYSRSGLLEALLNTFLALTVLFVFLAQRNVAWILAAQWALVLAFFTKMSGLYILPLALAGGVVAYVRQLRAGLPLWLKIAPFAQAAAIVAGVSWYCFRPAYWRTVTWNYGHAVFDNGGIQEVEVSKLPMSKALGRLISDTTWGTGFYSLFPIAGALATIAFARLLYVWIRRRRFEAWDVIVAGWMASSFGVLLLTPLMWVHYRLILFPPVALLAASLIQAAMEEPWLAHRARLAHGAAAFLLLVDLSVHGYWIGKMIKTRTYTMRDATDVIREQTGNEGAVFAGMWAGPLVFDTKNKWFYVKELFNQTGEIQATLGITHSIDLDKGDLANGILAKHHPVPMRTRKALLQFDLRGHTVTLYKLVIPISDATLRR